MSKILQKLGLKKPHVIDFWDCSKLNLVSLPKEVLRHRNSLRTLLLNSNNIRDLPKTVFLIEGLEELDVSENDILFIPPGISQLTHLTSLVIGKNSLASVPDSIRHCEQLLTLDLSVNPLGTLCESLMELRQLRKLILNDTQLEALPPNIGKLSKLEILELRENMLQSLPVSMSHLSLLEKLDLGNNEFVTVPTVIGNLESLNELWLDMNTINSIPEELGNLHNLRFLELSENHIMVLPNTMSGLVKLTDLYAHDNLISSLPDSFGELSSLVLARLNGNRLGRLPESIYGLTSLREFDLSHNHLSEVPHTIGGITSLVNLNLDENLLVSIPAEIGLCTSLKYLSLRDNQIFELPPECSGLVNLKILNLIGNRLTNLPFALTHLKNLSAIWVAENQSRPIVELQVERNEKGEKWLTCFLLPQQGRESPYEEAISPLDAVADEDPQMRLMNKKSSQVYFDPKVTDKRNKISRDPTPFPKELHAKAMQWRAARDINVGEEVEQIHSLEAAPTGLDEVALRHPSQRRLVKNRYSLLKALSDPLDDSLNPAMGRKFQSSSTHESPPLSPDVIPTSKSERQSSKGIQSTSMKPPTSLMGSTSPDHYRPSQTSPSPRHSSRLSPSPTRQTQSPTRQTRMPTSDIQSTPPVSVLYYDEGSVVQSISSGLSPDSPSLYPISDLSGPQPPHNGSIGPSHNRSIGQFEHQSQDQSQQPHSFSNTNGNNNNNRGRYSNRSLKAPASIDLGNVNEVMLPKNVDQSQDHFSPAALQSDFTSQANTLLHSNIQENQCSMESGFEADTEFESNQTWYQSPNISPKSRRRSCENRPKLGPQVVLSPSVSPSSFSHSQITSESKDSHHSGSQLSQGESVSDDYERLFHDVHHDKARLLQQRRGSLDAVVMLSAQGKAGTFTYGSQLEYDQAYPIHKSSRSFDQSRQGHTSPTSPQQSQPPYPPNSWGTSIFPLPSTDRQSHSQRSLSAKSRHTQAHTRTHSQPEQMLISVVSADTHPIHSQPHSPPHSQDSLRASQSNEESPAMLPVYNHQRKNKLSDRKQRAHVQTNEPPAFRSGYPRHKGGHLTENRATNPVNRHPARNSVKYNGIHSSVVTKTTTNGVVYHSELQTFKSSITHPHEHVPHHSDHFNGYSNYTSDDSQTSGRNTPNATPTLDTKSNWVSGHDSGFDSMNRNNHTKSPPDVSIISHTGVQIEVELVKNRTLGLGITGGIDSDNAIKPGDTGFHVYKVIEGSPAHRSGKIVIGDKLLQVNGYDVSAMSSDEVLALLTSKDSVRLLFFREASLTLL